MVQERHILRQIKDIQAQAERLINNKASLLDIEQFSDYSNEIKSFLLTHIDDEFILKYINDIPDLNVDEMGNEAGLLNLLLSWFGGGLGVYSRERHKSDKALKIVRDIRGKYASAEFMLKNYFS